jgi:hypothetical protein
MDQFSLFARGLVQLNNANAVPVVCAASMATKQRKWKEKSPTENQHICLAEHQKAIASIFSFFYITLKNESTKHIARVTPSGSVVLWSLLCTL